MFRTQAVSFQVFGSSSYSVGHIREQIRHRLAIVSTPYSFCKHHGHVDSLEIKKKR